MSSSTNRQAVSATVNVAVEMSQNVTFPAKDLFEGYNLEDPKALNALPTTLRMRIECHDKMDFASVKHHEPSEVRRATLETIVKLLAENPLFHKNMDKFVSSITYAPVLTKWGNERMLAAGQDLSLYGYAAANEHCGTEAYCALAEAYFNNRGEISRAARSPKTTRVVATSSGGAKNSTWVEPFATVSPRFPNGRVRHSMWPEPAAYLRLRQQRQAARKAPIINETLGEVIEETIASRVASSSPPRDEGYDGTGNAGGFSDDGASDDERLQEGEDAIEQDHESDGTMDDGMTDPESGDGDVTNANDENSNTKSRIMSKNGKKQKGSMAALVETIDRSYCKCNQPQELKVKFTLRYTRPDPENPGQTIAAPSVPYDYTIKQPTLDWSVKKDIYALNQWRNQIFKRNFGPAREPRLFWLVLEKHFVLKLLVAQLTSMPAPLWRRLSNEYNKAMYKTIQPQGSALLSKAMKTNLTQDRSAPWRTNSAIPAQGKKWVESTKLIEEAKAREKERVVAEGPRKVKFVNEKEILNPDVVAKPKLPAETKSKKRRAENDEPLGSGGDELVAPTSKKAEKAPAKIFATMNKSQDGQENTDTIVKKWKAVDEDTSERGREELTAPCDEEGKESAYEESGCETQESR